MKKIIIVIAIIVIIAAGYTAMKRSSAPSTSDATTASSTSLGKLNINEVCASALTYMTFIDGTSSDKFVAECKEGKHPEVIEHYKAQMDLGDGAAI